MRDVIVYRRTGSETPMQAGRDLWWHELDAERGPEAKIVPPVPLDSEHPLFVLYTSGTTGKPKGILHTTGGYLTHVTATMKWVFDLQGRRHLLVLGRYRLGDGAQLHRLRAALGRGDDGDVRRRAGLSAVRPLVAAGGKISRQYSLHLADGDPRADPAGRSVAGCARSVESAPAGIGRRADQSGGVGMVSTA